MAQHSCCPNSIVSFVGMTAMLRATQDLAAGQCSVRVSLTHIIIIEYWASYQIDVETHSLSCPVLSCPFLSFPSS